MSKILELHGITKTFPGITALGDVDFDLRAGEVHALVGENGAGKSTLAKVITGVLQPTKGDIVYAGEHREWQGPQDAISAGIAAVYQDPSVFPDLDVAENIFMGHQPHAVVTRRIHWHRLHAQTEELLCSLNVNISSKAKLKNLSTAERQLVEIAKALSIGAKIVIMDEPTSALSISESQELFGIIEELKQKGTAIIFISHRVEDIFRIADRVTALRDGAIVGTRDIGEVDLDQMVRMMVGREVKQLFPKMNAEQGEEMLCVEHISRRNEFHDISFQVHRGEILGLYGLVGAGRTDVAKSIFGMKHLDSGKIYVRGKETIIRHPQTAISLGMAYLPEDRDEEGIILDMDISANITLPILRACSKLGWLDRNKEKLTAAQYTEMLTVKSDGLGQKLSGLSGGNKQKVSLAKWLASQCKLLILDEPTKGIDVGAKAAVHKFISELAVKGCAIVMISSELPEIMGMSDTILVMHEGVMKGRFKRNQVTEEEILTAALTDTA